MGVPIHTEINKKYNGNDYSTRNEYKNICHIVTLKVHSTVMAL